MKQCKPFMIIFTFKNDPLINLSNLNLYKKQIYKIKVQINT